MGFLITRRKINDARLFVFARNNAAFKRAIDEVNSKSVRIHLHSCHTRLIYSGPKGMKIYVVYMCGMYKLVTESVRTAAHMTRSHEYWFAFEYGNFANDDNLPGEKV